MFIAKARRSCFYSNFNWISVGQRCRACWHGPCDREQRQPQIAHRPDGQPAAAPQALACVTGSKQ
jgi:hypothetical protein